MFAGIFLGLTLATGEAGSTRYLFLAGALLVAVGTLDDRRSLPTRVRLAAEIAAALLMIVGGGLIIADIGDPFGSGTVYLGPAAIAGSVLVTVTVINAFNFIDGVDGLAACMVLVARLPGRSPPAWLHRPR